MFCISIGRQFKHEFLEFKPFLIFIVIRGVPCLSSVFINCPEYIYSVNFVNVSCGFLYELLNFNAGFHISLEKFKVPSCYVLLLLLFRLI